MRNTPGTRLRGAVLIVGPDGSGKTTIADALAALARDQGATVTRAHWRPNVVARRNGDGSPVTTPHAQPPRGLAVSAVKLGVVALDFAIGHLTLWRRARKHGLLIVERGWHDQIVDPRRYRLHQRSIGLARALGRVVPRSDLAVICAGDATAINLRKPELPVNEIESQLITTRALANRMAVRALEVDTVASSPETVAKEAWDALTTEPKWRRIPIAPRRLDLVATEGARAALDIYRPARPRARVAARASHHLFRVGVARRTDPRAPYLRELAQLLGIAPDAMAVMRSSQVGRSIVGFEAGGKLVAVAKIGSADDAPLRNEAAMLSSLASLEMPFAVPTVLIAQSWRDHFVLVTEGVASDGVTPVLTYAELLDSLRALRDLEIVHGDFTSWNFVRSPDGRLTLLDWEASTANFDPTADLTRYAVQEASLLRRCKPADAIDAITRVANSLALEPPDTERAVARARSTHARKPARATSQVPA